MCCSGLPDESLFPVSLLETRPGAPASCTGVPPSFLTMRISGEESEQQLSIEMSRPFKIVCHRDNVDSLRFLAAELERFRAVSDPQPAASESQLQLPFQRMRLQAVQVVLEFVVPTPLSSLVSVTAGLSHVQLDLVGHADATGRKTEKLDGSLSLGALCLKADWSDPVTSVQLCDPLNLELRLRLSWPRWMPLPAVDGPMVHAFCRADNLRLHFGPRQMEAAQALSTFIQSAVQGGDNVHPPSQPPSDDQGQLEDVARPETDEQHYQDDLRTGAFDFQVRGDPKTGTDRATVRPSAYQVVFNVQPASMCWAYPQPRALTRVDVYPIPLLKADSAGPSSSPHDSQEDGPEQADQVDCALEYWDECSEQFRPLRRFSLSETKLTRVPLPAIPSRAGNPSAASKAEGQLLDERVVFSDLWRIVMNFNESHLPESRPRRIIAAPPSLVACTRIDSYADADAVPVWQLGLSLSHASVTLHHNRTSPAPALHPQEDEGSPPCFLPDGSVPAHFPFASLTLNQSRVNVQLAPGRGAGAPIRCGWMDGSTQLQAAVVNFEHLVQEPLLEPTGESLE